MFNIFFRYQEKAKEDLNIFSTILHEIMAQRGVFKESIKPEEIK